MRWTCVLLAMLLLAACTYGTGTASPSAPASVTATPVTPVPATAAPTPARTPAPTPPEPTLPPKPDWADRTPSPECLNPPPDLMAIIFNSERLTCYGNDELTAVSTVDRIGAVDWAFESCEPEWLCIQRWRAVAIVETASAGSTVLAVNRGPTGWAGWIPPDLWFSVHPESGITDEVMKLLVYPESVPVRVTGHFDDPAAQTCNAIGLDATPEEFIDECRNRFVVTGITPLAG